MRNATVIGGESVFVTSEKRPKGTVWANSTPLSYWSHRSEAWLDIWKLQCSQFDFCFPFSLSLIHCVRASALCKGEMRTKPNVPFLILRFLQALTCQSMFTQCGRTIVLQPSSLSVSHTWMHACTQSGQAARHQHSDRPRQTQRQHHCLHSLPLILPFLSTHVPWDHVLFSPSPSSRSGFELYYFLLAALFVRGGCQKQQLQNNFSIFTKFH